MQTRLQAGKGYKSSLHCIISIYKKETVSFRRALMFIFDIREDVKQKHSMEKKKSLLINCVCVCVFQVAGFFKGMSFPLASITVYNSVVFGFFSNAKRFISKHRYGDERHPCGMWDLTVASALTGLMSVGLGAPVDLVKIRLQMQTQMILAGTSKGG